MGVRTSIAICAKPESHLHVAEHRGRKCEVLRGFLPLAHATVELAKAEMAAGEARAHAELLG
jgi:hypothetical protein